MLSEQERKTLLSILLDPEHHRISHNAWIDEICEVFAPHLQRPLDREAVHNKLLLMFQVILQAARDMELGKRKGFSKEDILRIVGNYVNDFEALHNGESGPEMTRGNKSDKEIYDGEPTKRRFSFDEAKEKLQGDKPVCGTCGGVGENKL